MNFFKKLFKKWKKKKLVIRPIQQVYVALAGNYKEYMYFMKNKPKHDYKYISRVDQILGLCVADYEIIGTFWYRQDASDLYDAVLCRISK